MAVLSYARFAAVRPAAGAAYLSGVTAVAGSPDTPVRRLVQLFTYSNAHGQVFPSNAAIDWQWSDASGTWRFDNLDPSQRYGVIAYDHTGTYDPVVKLNLIPTP